MGRPSKDSGIIPAEERLKDAFWELVKTNPVEKITVSMITAKARCNRGTFYYYYDDIHSMVARLIDENLPWSLPHMLVAFLTHRISEQEFSEYFESEGEQVDKLSLLMAAGPSAYVTTKMKASMIEVWTGASGIGADNLPCEARIIFEFTFGGLLSILAYRIQAETMITIPEVFKAIMPDIPVAIINRLQATTPGILDQLGQRRIH